MAPSEYVEDKERKICDLCYMPSLNFFQERLALYECIKIIF